jgi:hypothetical protein
MRLIVCAVVLTLMLGFGLAAAQTRYVAPTGNDADNDCADEQQPCKTLQRAFEAIPYGSIGGIKLADGIYPDGLNSTYFKLIQVIGNCDDPSAVVVQGGYWAQDLNILTISCVTTPWVACRQYAIMDLHRVHFLENLAGYHIAANESCKINLVGGTVIAGGAAGHMTATLGSIILADSDITVPNSVSFLDGKGCFFSASSRGIIRTGNRSQTGIFGLGMQSIAAKAVCTDGKSDVELGQDLHLGTLQ